LRTGRFRPKADIHQRPLWERPLEILLRTSDSQASDAVGVPL
jgi:hypothetical protein